MADVHGRVFLRTHRCSKAPTWSLASLTALNLSSPVRNQEDTGILIVFQISIKLSCFSFSFCDFCMFLLCQDFRCFQFCLCVYTVVCCWLLLCMRHESMPGIALFWRFLAGESTVVRVLYVFQHYCICTTTSRCICHS